VADRQVAGRAQVAQGGSRVIARQRQPAAGGEGQRVLGALLGEAVNQVQGPPRGVELAAVELSS